MTIVRMFTTLAIILVLGFVGLCSFLYLSQNRIVFVPSSDLTMTPGDIDLQYEDVYIDVTDGEKINGWYLTAEDPEAATVLFCHGNAGNISHRLQTVQLLHDLDLNIFLYDYRGYGLSDGSPSEENTYQDALAAYHWLLEQKATDSSSLFVFGRSLGGAVAVELASRVKCAGLLVESSFTSAAEMGRRMFPFIPIRFISRYKYNTASRIGQLNCPVLVTHSPEDQLIPYKMGRTLFDLAPEPKQFIDLTGDHNELDYFENEKYINGLQLFFNNRTSPDNAGTNNPQNN